MALVLPFPPPQPGPSPALLRIRRLSAPLARAFTVLFCITAAACLALGLAVLFHDGPWLQARSGVVIIRLDLTPPPVPPGWSLVGALPLVQRLAMVGSGLLMMGPALAVLWTLRRLFRLYAAGVVLETRNARCFSLIAVFLLAYAAGPALGHLLVEAAGFEDRGWLRLDSLQALGLGAILFVIARVMRLGAEIREDAERFV